MTVVVRYLKIKCTKIPVGKKVAQSLKVVSIIDLRKAMRMRWMSNNENK